MAGSWDLDEAHVTRAPLMSQRSESPYLAQLLPLPETLQQHLVHTIKASDPQSLMIMMSDSNTRRLYESNQLEEAINRQPEETDGTLRFSLAVNA